MPLLFIRRLYLNGTRTLFFLFLFGFILFINMLILLEPKNHLDDQAVLELVSGHTALKTPDPFRTPKLSTARPG